MQCPKCESQEVYLCSLANEQGTTKSTTSGSISGGGSGGLEEYTVESETTSQTFLAKQAAPPSNAFATARGTLILLIIAYIVITVVGKLAGIQSLGLFGPVMFVLIAGAAISMFIGYGKLAEYHEALTRWKKSWICGSCGTIFIP